MKETVKMELITPQIAVEMLAKNTNNRKLKPTVVQKYKEDLLNDRWIPGTCMLIFSEDGTLLDGQHRLKAIIEADKPANMIVSRGVSKDASRVIDSGSTRTISDMFKIEGISYASNVGGIVIRFDELNKKNYQLRGARRFSHQEIWEKYQEHSAWYDEAAQKASFWNNKSKMISGSLLGSIYVYLTKVMHHPEEKVNLFIEQICDIVPCENETISNFRRTISNYMLVGKKLTEAHLIVYIIRTWNAYLKGQILKQFRNMNPTDTDIWFL